MPDQSTDRPIEKVKETAQKAVMVETSLTHVQWYRTAFFWGALLLAVVLFGMLTFLVETTPSFPIDIQITRAIQSIDSPFFAELMWLVSWAGFLPQSVLITLLIGFTLAVYGFRWESATSLLTALVSGVINEFVKVVIQRPRPAADLVDVFKVLTSYSFPSGHVMFYVSLFGFVWYLSYTTLKQSWKRSLLLGFFGILILLVGISRVYLGQHWASDVLGAYLLGGLILAGTVLLHQWGKKRFFLQHSSALHHAEKE
jgi:undecaprenyl-diphosphatase